MYISECTLGLFTVTEGKPDVYQAEERQSSVFYVSLTFTIGEDNDPNGMKAHTYVHGGDKVLLDQVKSPSLQNFIHQG